MEKLLKREKEVSTLTSQVEALKSQIGGKQARSALFPSSLTSLFFQRFRDKISWNIEFLRRHCVFHVQVFHFRIKRGEAWYFPAAFPSSLGFKLRTCQLSLSINKKIKKYACLCGDWRLYFPTVTPSSSRGGTCSSPLHSLIVTQKSFDKFHHIKSTQTHALCTSDNQIDTLWRRNVNNLKREKKNIKLEG